MLNPEPQGGWGAGTTTAVPNPFHSTTPQTGNPFAKPPPTNPFLQNQNVQTPPLSHNPFAAPATIANPFTATTPSTLKRPASPSSTQRHNGNPTARSPFGVPKQTGTTANSAPQKPSTSIFRASSTTTNTNGTNHVAEFVQPAWPKVSSAPAPPAANSTVSRKRKDDLNVQSRSKISRTLPTPRGPQKNTIMHNGRSYELASKIEQQLSKDRIKPPQWPINPGSHVQRQAMEAFRESYRVYREKARKSLIRAGLIDDPDQRRTLEQALDFRGISEDMCPEWEKITRITEFDVRNPEKAPDDSGDLVAVPSLMVKRLARSAAGQDAPLPMDVRSFATLRKTLDYLIDDLIPSDDLLPSKHNFLWDRTRAIRIDLSVQKYNLTTDERSDLVYCLETIARFHVIALHLLSQDGFAAEDFSEQQEIEQLGKTLMSLKELYDDCVEQGIECVNEAEFRGYYVIFNARSPSIKETVEGWGSRLWNADGIRTAMCLVEALQNTWTLQGPLNPYAPTELALGAAAMFFSIVSSPQISYTMACFAEIHFNGVRKSMLQIIKKSYSRPRDGPKDITPKFLKDRLRFDTEAEAIDFAQKHGLEFGTEGGHQYMILNSRQPIEDPRIRHAFSRNIVERKRSGRPLPSVIHETVYQEVSEEPTVMSQQESLFVADSSNGSFDSFDSQTLESETESLTSTPLLSSPIATNTQLPGLKNGTLFQPAVAKTTTREIFGEPDKKSIQSIFSNHDATTFPPRQDLNPIVPHALPSVTEASTAEGGEGNKIDDASLTPSQKAKQSVVSDDKATTTTNSGSSPSLFSFLDKGAGEAATPLQNPSTLFDASTKPSYPGTNAEQNSSSFVAQPTITPKSTEARSQPESSSGLSHTQSPRTSTGLSLSPPTPFTSIVSTNGSTFTGQNASSFSTKFNPKPSLAEQPSNTGIRSLPATELSSKPPTTKPEELIAPQKSLSSAVPTITPTFKKDLMGDFTHWFVLADKGLMKDQLEEFILEHILKGTWGDFKVAEEERVRKEEDERSWAEARRFRTYSLQVTFFYRWLDIFRKRRVVKRIQIEKEKARKWRSPRKVAERELAAKVKNEMAIQEAKELLEKRTRVNAEEATRMRQSTRSCSSFEDALLATGVLSGVRDERASARYATQDDNVHPESDMLPGEKLRLRSENQRRRKRGLPPLKRFPEPKAYKEGSKTAMLRAISSGTGRDSLSMSTGSLRNSTFSSSYRSSLGFNPSRVSKSRSHVTDPYWRMKANGLVQMPNGEYLHESLALPMLQEGKRFPGLGNYGLPPEEILTPSQSPSTSIDIVRYSTSPTPDRNGERNKASGSSSILEGITQKRKRGHAEDDDLTAYQSEAPASRKRAKSGEHTALTDSSSDQEFLASIANLLNEVNAAAKSSAL